MRGLCTHRALDCGECGLLARALHLQLCRGQLACQSRHLACTHFIEGPLNHHMSRVPCPVHNQIEQLARKRACLQACLGLNGSPARPCRRSRAASACSRARIWDTCVSRKALLSSSSCHFAASFCIAATCARATPPNSSDHDSL